MSTQTVDRKIYEHLILKPEDMANAHVYTDDRKYNIWYFYITSETKDEFKSYDNRIYVAMLETGELVYVKTGYIDNGFAPKKYTFIGKGTIHHYEMVT